MGDADIDGEDDLLLLESIAMATDDDYIEVEDCLRILQLIATRL